MDYNNYLLFTLMPIGRYDPKLKKVHINKIREIINYVIIFINVFCGLKTALIVLSPDLKMVFYLIDLHIHAGIIQKLFHLGIIFIHFATGYAYWYWNHLNKNVHKMECLDFLFMPNLKELCDRYELDLKSTKNFIRKSSIIRFFVDLLNYVTSGFFLFFLSRCLYLSYFEVDQNYFIFVCIPLFVITQFSYNFMTFGILAEYTIMFITMEFIILRAQSLSKKLFEFSENAKINLFDHKKLKLSKNRPTEFKLINELNSILVQFERCNKIFDDTISFAVANVWISALVYPGFVFVDYAKPIKVLTVILYFGGAFCIGFSITIYNDFFIRNVSKLFNLNDLLGSY